LIGWRALVFWVVAVAVAVAAPAVVEAVT